VQTKSPIIPPAPPRLDRSFLSTPIDTFPAFVPSGAAAQKWEDVAQYPKSTDAVAQSVGEMQQGKSFGPLVMANRYDGIDLAGNSCRLLVMDGLPQGTSDYDMYRMNVMANSSVNSLLAQRVEQGIGRGTRGGADYCVVILTGDKLVGWIGRKVNLDQLTASTRAQLKMGQEVSEEVTKSTDVLPTVMKCLERDHDWVAYHASELAEAAQVAPVDELALRIAGGERKAFQQQRMGQFEPALGTLEKLISDPEVAKDTERTAWLSASAARIAYQMGDDARGQRLQTNAFMVNNNHCPPKQRPQYQPRPTPGKQSEAIIKRFMQYDGVARCSPTSRTPFPTSFLTHHRAGTKRRWPTLGRISGSMPTARNRSTASAPTSYGARTLPSTS
jgi:hypothetical protein